MCLNNRQHYISFFVYLIPQTKYNSIFKIDNMNNIHFIIMCINHDSLRGVYCPVE